VKRTLCEPVFVNPLPKNVIYVLPLDGIKAGLKKRGDREQKRRTELSFANIFVNLLF
jgi:hypothetical protein